MQPYTIVYSAPDRLLHDDPEGHYTLTRSLHYIAGAWRVHLHFEVHYFAPSVLRKIDKLFAVERPKLPAVIGAVLNHNNPVGAHYMRRFGFEPMGEVPWPSGSDHTFWIHRLA